MKEGLAMVLELLALFTAATAVAAVIGQAVLKALFGM